MLPGTVNNGFWGVARLVPLHVLSVSLLAAVHMRRHAGAHPLHVLFDDRLGVVLFAVLVGA